ncbi:MAG TPA: AAA family ATPase [Candidatus Saccharimonadales bacterium]|nr:AAA family ATPase [Candidatus Saccharimonadales bacterium]
MGKQIIGIAGTNGSGKDTVGHALAEGHGYLFVSVTDVLRAELKRQGFPADREHLRELSASWRRQFGYGVLIDRAMDVFYDQPKGKYHGIAIASLRNPFEVDRIHELGGVVWWLDADPLLRFTRIRANAATRARAQEDEKTFEEFLAEEQAEMHATGDAATLNMSAVRDKADTHMQNGGNSLGLLKQEVAALLAE